MTPTTAAKVPPFKVEFSPDEVESILAGVRQVLSTGRLMLGPITDDFEQGFAKTVGAAHGVSCATGSVALEIIFRYLNVAGKEVLVPSNTNFATAASVLHAGGTPIFFEGGLYPDFADISRKATSKTAAVCIVHIGGYITPEIRKIRALCDDRGWTLVEDAAHAHHATLDGVQAGKFGQMAAFSFFPTKVITTGEGGMIVTDDAELARQARRYRDQGKDESGMRHIYMGNSWRLTECGAAIGRAMLPTLAKDTAYRQQVMDRFARELAGSRGLVFPESPAGMQPSGYKSIALLDKGIDRAKWLAAIDAKGVIMARGVYEIPLHRQPIFQPWVHGAFPLTDDFCDRHVCLPLWRGITTAQTDQVIDAVRAACREL